jgi:formate dehydrogenase alpha subunit
VLDEVVRVTPIYGGMRHTQLGGSGLVWPCPAADHPGTPILHTETFMRGYTEINVQDAAAGVRDGGPVLITSRRGQVRTRVRVGQRVPPGTAFLSCHWKEAPANLLIQDFALDQLADPRIQGVCGMP